MVNFQFILSFFYQFCIISKLQGTKLAILKNLMHNSVIFALHLFFFLPIVPSVFFVNKLYQRRVQSLNNLFVFFEKMMKIRSQTNFEM